MKKLLLLMIFPLILMVSNSQNMVIDGSIENYVYIPIHYSTENYEFSENLFYHLTNCICSRNYNNFRIYNAGENV